jgi:epoxyqueuosine reductase
MIMMSDYSNYEKNNYKNCKKTDFNNRRKEMKKRLLEYCRSLDIESVGIAPAEPYLDFESIWRSQIGKGHTSGFEEKDIAKRVCPELTLQDARSVVVCLFPYYSGTAGKANITKSAYSVDYHVIAAGKLNKVGKFLENRIECFHFKAFVDNGPFSDRYLAYKAGLGFWGINSHLITAKYGSYFFIGHILNNFPFEPDTPQGRTCLQCMECARNCPGQCIMGDFTINPKRCKSYLTQKKGSLTQDEKDIIRKTPLIWGCDVCQDVCPHNKSMQATAMEEFRTDLVNSIDIDELKRLSNREFRKKYGNRSFSWRGRDVLIRNHEIIHGG